MPEVRIERVVPGGDGLARLDGAIVFVPFALPGDVVELSGVTRRKSVLRAEIRRILEPSPDRVAANCPVFGRCGGCSWLPFAYPAQADAKRGIVADCFHRIAGHDVDVSWRDVPAFRLGYRTRATFHAVDGAYGFYRARSHAVEDIDACPLCHPRLNATLQRLRESGLRGEFDVTVNPEGDDVLVWTRDETPGLGEVFPMNNHRRDSSERHAFPFDGVPVVCGGFSQASLLLNRVLREMVFEELSDASSVLDLYCGSGNFTLGLADGRRVRGLDHHAPSIAAANALLPGTFNTGDESVFVREVGRGKWDAILLDPPRQGAKAIVPALARSRAHTLVYVSCDPATLARDSKALFDAEWDLVSMTAVDMFPHTAHVETVAVFRRSCEHR
jgi:23S rRNA (uracil1939-C5)-methyltransferase